MSQALCPLTAKGWQKNRPNTDTEDGLPYIQKDGQTNPDNFKGHQTIGKTEES